MATRKRIVSYLRTPQAPGDASLDAQRRAVQAFAQASGYRVVEEFVDDGGGGAPGRRVRLDAAIDRAHKEYCPIVAAGLEYLSRDVRVVEEIAAREVPVIAAGQAPVVVRAYRAWSRRERERHGRKIKHALAARKAEGIRLGNTVNLAEAGAAGRETQIARADAFAAEIQPVIDEIRALGVTSFNGIAKELNRHGITTARGGHWVAMSVKRIVDREDLVATK